MEYFDYNENRMMYYSLMLLNQPSHLDTGFYYCAPVSESINNVKKYTNIYIYVKGNIFINNIKIKIIENMIQIFKTVSIAKYSQSR